MANHAAPSALADQIIADLVGKFNVAELVQAAKVQLKVADAAPDATVLELTGQDAILVNELNARADELARVAKAATDEREQIKQLLRDTAGDHDVLKVNGAEVVTQKTVITRVLDQQAVKTRFPDIPGNEWAYKDQVSRPLRFK